MCGIDGIADVLMGRRSEMPYMKRKGNIMLYGWKAKRHLALYVSIALSCGGGYSLLASPHAYSADVTGGNVVVDATHPAPTPIIAGNALVAIPGATDNRNVTGNTLRVTAVNPGHMVFKNFEKIKFELGDNIHSGDTMLRGQTTDTFDWSKITVTGLSNWVTALNAAGTNDPKLTLYTGGALTLNNYAPPDRKCRRLRIRHVCEWGAFSRNDDGRDTDQACGQ